MATPEIRQAEKNFRASKPEKLMTFRTGVILVALTFVGLSAGIWGGLQRSRAIEATCKQQAADRSVLINMLNLLTAPRTLADGATEEQKAFQETQNQEAAELRKNELAKQNPGVDPPERSTIPIVEPGSTLGLLLVCNPTAK